MNEKIKNAIYSAFVPGSLTYNAVRVGFTQQKADDIRSGERKTTFEQIYCGIFAGAYNLVPEVVSYLALAMPVIVNSFSGLENMVGTSEMITASITAFGLRTAGNLIYKGMESEYQLEIDESKF